jgi:hypothetical protein
MLMYEGTQVRMFVLVTCACACACRPFPFPFPAFVSFFAREKYHLCTHEMTIALRDLGKARCAVCYCVDCARLSRMVVCVEVDWIG